MQVDTIKALFTYVIAAVVVIGGGALLFLSRNDPDPSEFNLVVAGFIGGALTFVFNGEASTRASRSTERAIALTPSPAPPPADAIDATAGDAGVTIG